MAAEQKPASIALSPDGVVLTALGAYQPMEASVFDANERAMSAELTWASSDPAIASVDEEGRITARANGTATVTATVGSITGFVAVTVRQSVSRIEVLPETVTLTSINQNAQLEATALDAKGHPVAVDIGFTSSESTVASVDDAGLVTAQVNGTVTITATVSDQGRAISTTVAITVRVSASPREPLTVTGDPNVRDPRTGRTPLHIAAMANAPRLIAALVEAGADIEARDRDGLTPLHAATNSPVAIAALLEAGAELEARNRFGQTPLAYAVNRSGSSTVAAIEALLEAGADSNVGDLFSGRTPLHWAAWWAGASKQAHEIQAALATLSALLEAGADPNARDRGGDTPLHRAVIADSPAATALLLQAGADPNAPTSTGITPLQNWVAAGKENLATMAALLDAGADLDHDFPLLHLAAVRDKPVMITALLEAGADLNTLDDSGGTALHAAAGSSAVRAPVAAAAAIVALLEAGADPNARDDSGHTALQLASAESAALMRTLLDAHAGRTVDDPNARDAFGYTALHAAARANSPELIAVLVDAGADLTAGDRAGDTALQVALYRGNPGAIAALAQAEADHESGAYQDFAAVLALAVGNPAALVDAEVDPNARDRRGRTALYWVSGLDDSVALPAVAALLEAGADPNAADRSGWTPLHQAAYRRNTATIAALAEAGADLNGGSSDRTALHVAVATGNSDTIAALAAAGADLEARDQSGRTALHQAAYWGEPAKIAALLEAGADLEARDLSGRTALQLAASRDVSAEWVGFQSTPAAVAALLEAGADLNTLDNDGNTALLAAATAGNQAATGMLLALGSHWTSGPDAAVADFNARIVAVELFQGPMVWQWELDESQATGAGPGVTEGDFADHAKTLLYRATTVAVRIGSKNPDPMPELSVSLSDAHGRTWATEADLVRAPRIVSVPSHTESGLWETEYIYELPADWADSGHRASFEIDPYNRLEETDETDNTVTLTLDGYAVPVFDVTFVPIVFSGDPPGVNTEIYMAVIGDLLPIGDYRARVGRPLDLSDRNLGSFDKSLSKRTALDELLQRWNAEAGENEYYHGLLSSEEVVVSGYGGQAFKPGNVAVSDAIRVRCQVEREFCGNGVHAHEIGHNFDLAHVPGGCNETEPIDHEYPYRDAGIGPRRGWVDSRNEFVNPGVENQYFDLMGFCIPHFVSDYNYNKMVDYRLGNSQSPPDNAERIGPSIEIGPAAAGAASALTLATTSPEYAPLPGTAASSAGSGPGVALTDTVEEIGPSLAFAGAVDEYGLWSIGQLDASTQPPRSPGNGGQYFFTLWDAYQREIYREPMSLLTTAHGETRQAWAVRVPVPERSPAWVAILDAQGTPLFIEPIDMPADVRLDE